MKIYADNASTTEVDNDVLGYMMDCYSVYGNPSCSHVMGLESRKLIENARNIIAKRINAKPDEIVFTSGGTESNNFAILGFVDANSHDGRHIITTGIEHVSVLNVMEYLQENGYEISYIPVNKDGIVNLEQLRNSIYADTILISVIYANNEIGTIQNIKEIGKIAKNFGITFHTDAVQAFGHIDIDVNELGINMMSISAHKIYGPKGAGALYVNENINIEPVIYGGGQEWNLRSGTENVQGIAGFGKAVELLQNTQHINELKNKLKQKIISIIPDIIINSPNNGLPNILNVSFTGVDGDVLVKMLSDRGIYVASGSACTTSSLEPSHVLMEIGLSEEMAKSAIRFSFGKYNSKDEIPIIITALKECVDIIRGFNSA